jgi:general secretion pathway protein D
MVSAGVRSAGLRKVSACGQGRSRFASRWAGRAVIAAASLAGALLLAGCADTAIRAAARSDFQEGRYEKSVHRLEQGLKDHPDSGLLRGGLLETKADALARLWADAAAARTAGKTDEAREALRRALALEPANTRTRALLADLEVDQQQRSALAEAKALVAAQQPRAALRRLEEALKDNPRQSQLQELRRELDMKLHQAQSANARMGLAESRPISLDFRDASLRTVLDVVSRNSGISFILDKDIRPDIRVTVYLRSARVEDAIDLITSTYQLSRKLVDAKTLLIYPNTPEKQREHQEQVVKVFYLANAEAKNAAAFLKAMAKVRDPYVDERSNMLAIRESAETVQMAERMIAMFDTAEPEVLLDVQVIEIRTNRLTELGVKLPGTLGLTVLPPAGQGGLTLANVDPLSRDRIGLSIGGVTVNLRRETGDYNLLANPSIRARSKEKAKVMIGDKLPVVTTTTGVGGFVSDSVSYLDVGLKLEVEPTVYVDDEVAIRVGLEVSSLASQIKTASGGLAYQIGTRNASTLLRLRDGETQLLAGLINKEDRSDASRVPGLGDLPLAGRLFSSTLDNTQQTELVLSITPHVLRNLQRPTAAESELWVGTDAAPRVRPVGGIATLEATAEAGRAPGAQPALAEPRGASSSPTATLRWQGPASVKQGEEFGLQLHLQGGQAMRGASLQLGLDTEHLQFVAVEEGGYFRQGDADTSFTRSVEGDGRLVRVGVLRNQATAASGEGSVLTLKLKALKAGKAQVALSAIDPIVLDVPTGKPALPVVTSISVMP